MNTEEPMERETMLSRVVDRSDAPADWGRLDEVAAREGDGLWQELADWLRADALLRDGLAAVTGTAVPLPTSRTPAARTSRRSRVAARSAPSAPSAWAGWAGWAGWAAAVLVSCGWFAATRAHPTVGVERPAADESLVADSAPSSRVLDELPLMLLESRPAVDGNGYELTVMRRVLESRRVDAIVDFALDEEGTPRAVVADPARFRTSEAL